MPIPPRMMRKPLAMQPHLMSLSRTCEKRRVSPLGVRVPRFDELVGSREETADVAGRNHVKLAATRMAAPGEPCSLAAKNEVPGRRPTTSSGAEKGLTENLDADDAIAETNPLSPSPLPCGMGTSRSTPPWL